MGQIWKIINEPLSILLIGSAIGWVFINLIWEPYQKKRKKEEDRDEQKKEVYLRLAELNMYFTRQWFGIGIDSIIDGSISLNPKFKDWKIVTLVHSGWNEIVYEEIFDYIASLKELTNLKESNNKIDKKKAGLEIIQKIKTILKTNEKC